MINYFELEFIRTTAHRIEAKSEDAASSIATPGTEIISLDPDSEYKIKEKLFEASDKKSKSFDLRIGNRGGTSFWGIAADLDTSDNATFISETGRLSLLLAEAQTTGTIKQSYLITIHARSADSGRYVFIAIKAELNEAFVFRNGEIKLIDDLFMSPETKLFKFGIVYRYEPWEKVEMLDENGNPPPDTDPIDSEWGAFLFDDQFRPDSKPAAYFWRDFLGFSLEDNAKIQSKRFYDATEKFLEANVPDYEQRRELIQALDLEISSSDTELFSPNDFTDSYIHDTERAEIFRQQVARHMPENIIKDISLITSKLNTKKISFPGKVKISAPAATLDTSVEIITSQEELQQLSTQQETYTIVKIMGKPHTGSTSSHEPDNENGEPQYIINNE